MNQYVLLCTVHDMWPFYLSHVVVNVSQVIHFEREDSINLSNFESRICFTGLSG
jgi:hypothetical protein